MKNLLIVGPPRCGKTSLIQMIDEKYPCEIIRTDPLEVVVCHAILQERFADSLQIEENSSKYPILDEKFRVHLYKHIYEQVKIDLQNHKKLIIIDAFNISLYLLQKSFGKEFAIYCLGMPNITVDELIKHIRLHNNKADWTNVTTDDGLRDFCETIINQSKIAKERADRFPKIKFCDTSGNRQRKLEIIFKDIEKNIIQVK